EVIIDVGKQRVYLITRGKVALETQVSTARTGKHTPRGTFSMTERVRNGKVSTIYGVVMPYWMRLGTSPYGVHAGYLPGYPASAGCIRLPHDGARLIYETTARGSRVRITSRYAGPTTPATFFLDPSAKQPKGMVWTPAPGSKPKPATTTRSATSSTPAPSTRQPLFQRKKKKVKPAPDVSENRRRPGSPLYETDELGQTYENIRI
ncbi:MAG: L,D-transpeptidase, partial [Verrucomicrobiota bacterium]